ncbi:MAG: HK97 family phage prohead protease, partial [Actinomycetota bacterium]|nr:HK97 family phage prohead protease [Actinomycetota bacterium]
MEARGRLDRSPKANWVEKAGGLPDYIERIAVHLKRKGMTTSHAIATAINAAKKMCATGDLNFSGKQSVNMGSKAQACAAVARWTAMKASRDAGEEDPEWGDIWHQAAVLDSEDRLHELDNVGDAMTDFSGLEGFDAGPDLDTQEAMRSEGFEYRSVPFKDADVKGRHFRGLAAVFDAVADLGEFTEEIRRGGFRRVLSTTPYVPMLYNHNSQLPPLASTRSGMTLKEIASGLLADAELANHFAAEAVLEGVERGDIRGMSIGFVAGAGNSDLSQRDGRVHRVITNFKKLLDVSPTHDPAYAETSAEVRSMIRRATLLDEPQTDLSGQQPQTEEPVVVDVEGCEECG